jgi:cellulase
MKIPSDIKPGTYVFRTELLALHGTMAALQYTTAGGSQFYPHCFSAEITGSGNATPQGVTIPGAYVATDPGLKLMGSAKYVRTPPLT